MIITDKPQTSAVRKNSQKRRNEFFLEIRYKRINQQRILFEKNAKFRKNDYLNKNEYFSKTQNAMVH